MKTFTIKKLQAPAELLLKSKPASNEKNNPRLATTLVRRGLPHRRTGAACLASHFLALSSIDLGIATIPTDRGHTTLWCALPHVVIRVTLPVRSFFATKKASNKETPYVAFIPTFNDIRFSSKWQTASTHISNILHSLVFKHVYEFAFVGYNYGVECVDNKLVLSLGLSHKKLLPLPHHVFVEVVNKRQLQVFSFSKESAAQFAATLRSLRPVNAYTGKGLIPLFWHYSIKKAKSK